MLCLHHFYIFLFNNKKIFFLNLKKNTIVISKSSDELLESVSERRTAGTHLPRVLIPPIFTFTTTLQESARIHLIRFWSTTTLQESARIHLGGFWSTTTLQESARIHLIRFCPPPPFNFKNPARLGSILSAFGPPPFKNPANPSSFGPPPP